MEAKNKNGLVWVQWVEALPVSSFTILRCSSSLLRWLQLCSTHKGPSWAVGSRGTDVNTVGLADVGVPEQQPAQSGKWGSLPSPASSASIPGSAVPLCEAEVLSGHDASSLVLQ